MAHINDYEIDRILNGWTMTEISAANTAITLTRAAEVGRHHVIQKVDASYSDVTVSGLVQVKFGTTVIGSKNCHGAGALDFSEFGREDPTANQVLVVTLAAGSGGATGTLTVSGYTTGPRAGD